MADYDTPTGSAGDDLLARLKGWYKQDIVKVYKWRKEATEDFKFRDGDQYADEDKRLLEEQQRPVVVFNRTGVLVDAVVGSEIGNRREVRYIPREMADSKPNEMLTSAAEWFRDLCDAEDEETEAFKDAVTAGMGWTETRLDFSNNQDGDPKIERVDPMEMAWDCSASKANLADARRLWRVRKMSPADARALFPDHEIEDLNAAWADEQEHEGTPGHNNPGEEYQGDDDHERNSREITIVACQYLQEETYYKVILLGPDMQPQEIELDEAKHKIAEKQGAIVQSVRLKRKKVVQCFIGRDIIKKPEPTQTGTFTWACMTGLKDHDKGIFYGIVRRAKDPQRWANKWLSQMMHIMNSQAKGGILAERGAFDNDRDAEETWAKPEAITYLAKNALSNPSGAKIQPKPVAQFPAGFDRLLQYADEMIIKATGINMELLGMREVNQPGVLEYQRKQQGIAILASFFDGMRRYRKMQGRMLLKLIQNHLADGRLVRIVGDEQAQYVPLMRENIADVEYDIIIDDAPTSTNEKEKTWQIMMQVLPMFKDQLPPESAMLVAEYSPLPQTFIEKVKAMVQKAQEGGQEPDPMQQAAMQMEQQKLALEGEKLQLEMAKIQAEREKTQLEMAKMQSEGQLAVIEQQTERQKLGVEQIKAYASLTQAQNPAPVRAN